MVGGEGEVSSKEQVLGRIRSALREPGGDRAAEYAAIARGYQQAGVLDAAARLELFQSRLHDYGVHVAQCGGAGVAQAIAERLREHGKRGLLASPGFPQEWLPDGFEFDWTQKLDYQAIDASEGVVTTCAAAIAVTGTIVLQDLAPGQGARALSLIPDYHLCVVNIDQLVETAPEAIQAIDAAGIRTLTTISGPSATSDIEMTRVRGVHGPRTLEVIIRIA